MRVIFLSLFLAFTLAPNARPQVTAAQDHPALPPDSRNLLVTEGRLTQLDTDKSQLVIQGPDNVEMHFAYTPDTAIKGADNSVQGLSADTTTRLRIHYVTLDGVNTAIEIEILPAAG